MNTDLISSLLAGLQHPLRPPGSIDGFIGLPSDPDKAMGIGVVLHHRFAFYYWLSWYAERRAEKRNPPNLLTIDWHDDVGCERDFNSKLLSQLNALDKNELAMFCWAGLRSLDDGHVAPALYLNAINEVYVVLKQHAQRGFKNDQDRNRSIIDKDGRPHQIYYYDDVDQFLRERQQDDDWPLLLDLDLDYFSVNQGEPSSGNEPPLVTDREIRRIMSPRGRLMRWVLARLRGFTIALEPRYCGSLQNCAHILDVVSKTLFDPPLLHRNMKWRIPPQRQL